MSAISLFGHQKREEGRNFRELGHVKVEKLRTFFTKLKNRQP